MAKNSKKPKGALWEIVDVCKEAAQYTDIKNSLQNKMFKSDGTQPIPWCRFEFLGLPDADALSEYYWAIAKFINAPSTESYLSATKK